MFKAWMKLMCRLNMYKSIVNQMVMDYTPNNATEKCPVHLKIIPSSDKICFKENPSRLSAMENAVVKQQIEDWLQEGVIRESVSDVVSKVVLAKKKDGTFRMCIDYRKLNCLVLKDRFPIPIVEDVLEKMQSAKFFMVMDLKNGFFHVPVEENSKKYTAFITKQGVFEFNKAPFGFCNSPAIFVRFLNIIFQSLRNEGIMELYVDDIVVFGQTAEACLANVQKVLQRAQLYGLEIKWSKCQFLQNRIHFLGHTIQDGKVWPGHEKLKAVKNFPTPNNLRSVQAFLGLTGYFRKFVQDYALIAKPLTQLLKKDAEFKIAHEELAAVAMLKAILVEEPVLKIFKQTAKTQLHVDASKSGFGGVLLQLHDGKWHPVYYWSRKTTPHEEKLHSYILEVKAAYLATLLTRY